MSKTFTKAPKPAALTDKAIADFERGGAGQDTQTHISTKAEMEEEEPKRRLSVDLPESLHRRFKTVCSKTDKKMGVEVLQFIERRTAELEKE